MGREIDAEFLSSLALPAALALIAFFIRFTIKRQKIVIATFFLDIIAAVFVGVLVALGVEEYTIPQGLKWSLVTLGAMLGPELLGGLFQVTAMFSRSPVTLFVRIIRAIKGDPLDPEEFKVMSEWERDFIAELERERKNRERRK